MGRAKEDWEKVRGKIAKRAIAKGRNQKPGSSRTVGPIVRAYSQSLHAHIISK